MIIGICGKAGSGKDTVADFLVQNHSFVKVSLADPLKRFCQEVFDFSNEQLWGPSEKRNAPDKRYPRVVFKDYPFMDPQDAADIVGPGTPAYLTPRHALQQLGTEWGRTCYPNIWIEYGLRVAKKLSEEGGYAYGPRSGLEHTWRPGDDLWKTDVVFADIRFKNEVSEFKKAGAKLIRILRPGAGLEGTGAQHASEAEQDDIPDSDFDAVIHNEGTLEELRLQVRSVLRMLVNDDRQQKEAEDFLKAMDGTTFERSEVIVTDLKTVYPEGSSLVAEEVAVQFEKTVPLSGAGGTLAELLKKREEDVQAGKLMAYDESQKDIPPFKRNKKP